MTSSISFSQLGDGTWGVRYATRGAHPTPGTEVAVSKRDGSVKRVTLGAVVDRDQGAFPGPAVYYRIARREARA